MFFDGFWKALQHLNDAQLWAALVVIAVLVAAYLWRHSNAPGTAKLAAEQAERSEAIHVLEGQIAQQREDRRHYEKLSNQKISEQDARIRALESDRLADARYEQSYRHALSNRCQAFLLAFGCAHELLIRIIDIWQEMPDELKYEIDNLPRAQDIDARNPLPHRD